MTISSVGSSAAFVQRLQSSGLSADKAKLVDADAKAAVQQAGGKATADKASVRAALDAKIDADVASGKLSKSDAEKVKKTLDGMDAQQGSAKAGGAKAEAQKAGGGGGAGGGAGGGGGGGDKTEVSETVTVAGDTKTTTITYSDGSSTTTTGTATDSDKRKYEKGAEADTGRTAQDYLSTLDRGSLVDKAA